jgi:hypothetical protein
MVLTCAAMPYQIFVVLLAYETDTHTTSYRRDSRGYYSVLEAAGKTS